MPSKPLINIFAGSMHTAGLIPTLTPGKKIMSDGSSRNLMEL